MPAQLANEKRPFLKRNSEPSTSDSPTKIRRADSHGDQNKRLKNEDGGRIPIHPFGDVCVDDASHPDITAMSVLSLYERENEQSCSEMDTNRWVNVVVFLLILLFSCPHFGCFLFYPKLLSTLFNILI